MISFLEPFKLKETSSYRLNRSKGPSNSFFEYIRNCCIYYSICRLSNFGENHFGIEGAINELLTKKEALFLINNVEEYLAKSKKNEDRENLGELRKNIEEQETQRTIIDWMVFNNVADEAMLKSLTEILRIRLEKAEKNLKSCKLHKRIEKTGSLFQLSENEKLILSIIFIYYTDNAVKKIFQLISSSIVKTGVSISGHILRSPEIFSILTNISIVEVQKILNECGTLFLSGIITTQMEISSEIINFISGFSNKPLSSNYFREIKSTSVPLDRHLVKKRKVESLKSLIKNSGKKKGLNILLYGPPGSGKTEFSRGLPLECGKKLCEICSIDDMKTDSDQLFRIRGLFACKNSINSEETVVLVDEAEKILETSGTPNEASDRKSRINQYLDKSTQIILWTVNSIKRIDESTLRRFDFTIKFKSLRPESRSFVWNTIARRYQLKRLLNPTVISELSHKYNVNIGCMSKAAENAKLFLKRTGNYKKTLELLKNILESHEEVLFRKPLYSGCSLTSEDPVFEVNNLCTSPEIKQVLSSITNLNNNIMKTSNIKKTPFPGGHFLLFGPQGTGKNLFIKHIGAKLGRKVVSLRSSDYLLNRLEFEEIIHCEEESGSIITIKLDLCRSGHPLLNPNGKSLSPADPIIGEIKKLSDKLRTIVFLTLDIENPDTDSVRILFTDRIKFQFLNKNLIGKIFERFTALCSAKTPDPETVKKITELKNLTPDDFRDVFRSEYYRSEGLHNTDFREIYIKLREKSQRRISENKRLGMT
ncbi:MAG: AAA family ATPase [Fibrobacterota bacterium]